MTGRRSAERPELWAARAAVAERAVCARHLRRTHFGRALAELDAWPLGRFARARRGRSRWRAQLLDCAVDSWLRAPTADRQLRLTRLVRGIGGSGQADNTELASLALALHRARSRAGARAGRWGGAADRLRAEWSDHAGGGLWSEPGVRKGAVANGVAALLFAHLANEGGERSDLHRARCAVDWLFEQLMDGDLVVTGLTVAADGRVGAVDRTVSLAGNAYVLGACARLSVSTGERAWPKATAQLATAVADRLADADHVLRGSGGGAEGPALGLLARNLASAALALREDPAAERAAEVVFASAEAAWRNRAVARGGPLFGPEWTVPAISPTERPLAGENVSPGPRVERELSVQLAGWLALESAALLERAGFADRGSPRRPRTL
ncbi:putative alpha-1,6-mannanase (GH76 family) [Crossiella equi]|uniref:Alpha-1,6-mannanase (GH76 family) n=1 Tax=Crossiella equi TaxID=130796 RepID=A0ABS5AGQ1_9PSEU|nr:glycoside hydrolase family 76 protein [Crossiella equi]MBP2475763.1 putative alpha-1,6-mannanase (GH76 family) [Crossiella equi]